MSNYEILKKAILQRQSISCHFKGHYREMSPHVLGRKGNKYNCLFYQFGGSSSSGLSKDPSQNWRCIPINEITSIKIVTNEFYTAENHSRPQTCVDKIEVEIDF